MKYNLSDICEYAKGKIDVAVLDEDTYISTENMMPNKGGITSASSLPTVAQTQSFSSGDVLVSNIRPYFKKIWFAEYDGGCSNDVLVFRAKDGVSKRFLYYVLADDAFFDYSMATSKGTKMPRGDKAAIMKYEVPDFTYEEQEKIAGILEVLDRKIQLNTEINDNLYVQVRTLTKQWITENSSDYELLPLAKIASINPDTYSPKEEWEYVNYLDTSNITDGCIAEIQHITPSIEKLPSRARRKIAPNDVVFSTVRPNQRHFGILNDPMPNMLGSTGFAVIRSNHPLVSNELIYLCLTENEYIEKMQQLAEQSTSTFPSIKPSDLGVCEIPCPKDNASKDFTEMLKSMFALIAENQRENISLATIRDTLLPKLMCGALDVSNIQF